MYLTYDWIYVWLHKLQSFDYHRANIKCLSVCLIIITIPPMELSSEDESDFAKPEKLKANLQKKANNLWGEWKM